MSDQQPTANIRNLAILGYALGYTPWVYVSSVTDSIKDITLRRDEYFRSATQEYMGKPLIAKGDRLTVTAIDGCADFWLSHQGKFRVISYVEDTRS